MHNQDIFLKKKYFPCLLSFDSLLVESFTEDASSNHLEDNEGQRLEEKKVMGSS